MEMLKKLFPFSFRAADLKGLIITILIYIAIDIVLGFVIGLLSAIPLVGPIIGIVGTILGLYCLAGIIIAVLDYLKLFK